jgi:hypothetical protein
VPEATIRGCHVLTVTLCALHIASYNAKCLSQKFSKVLKVECLLSLVPAYKGLEL